MKHLLHPLALALALLPLACEDEDDDMDSGGDTAADDGGPADDGAPADDGGDAPATSESMETCDSMHECINDVCTCTTPGKEDQACTNTEACESECEVCM